MGEFLRVLLDSIAYLWPFRIVKQYERGVYYCLGHVLQTRFFLFSAKPGLKFILPFFCEVKIYAVNTQVYTLPRQVITLKDGVALTFQGVVVCSIEDIIAAELNVSSWTESIHEIASCALADYLAEFTGPELEVKSRRRMLGTLRDRIQNDIRQFGLKVERVSFSKFVMPSRVYHLINDAGGSAEYT